MISSRILFLIFFWAIITPVLAEEKQVPQGKALYQTACAACHGMNGKGAEPEDTGLSIALPDFVDCAFATREPDADWHAVIDQGGPARAFDPMMPAFGEALTAEEIGEILKYVRGFCRNRSWPRGELNLPRPLVTEKAYPEDEAVWTTTIGTEDDGSVLNEFVYEKRFGAQNQFEVAIPFGALESESNWSGGVGDIALGLKRALYYNHKRGTIFSIIGEVVLPTGDHDKGFGKGTTIFEPTIAFGQILPADSFIQFHGGFEISTDRGEAEHEAFWRTAVGRSFTRGSYGRNWSPIIEVLGTRELISGSQTDWDVVPQVQVTLSTRQHVMLNAGVRIPVNDTQSRPTRLMIYLLWDWFDGGFFDGW